MAQRRVVGFVCLLVVGGAVSTGCATSVGGLGASSQDPPASTPPDGGDGGAGGEGGGFGAAGQGGTAECDPGDVIACYGGDAALAGIGACVHGTQTCQANGEFTEWGACVGWGAPAAEACGDGVDNDCDGAIDEGCVVSGCRLPFPPPATVPCEVAETATRYYVDAVNGSDANSGVSPAAPWATLSHAVQSAAAGGTIRVAAGEYGSSSITVDKALVIKGGYDPTFTMWDPDVHHSSFTGAVDVHHDDAVWAGFRMIANVAAGGPTPWSQHFHTVWAGSLVRNVIGIVFTGSAETSFFQGIDSRTEVGHTTHILCNDIYMSTKGPQLWSDTVLDPDVLSGTTFIDSNRICFDEADPGNPHPTNLITGYGACVDQAHSHAYITNNILENVHQNVWSDGIEFYGCGDVTMSNNQMDITVVNNTILVHSGGVNGYSGSDGGAVVTWRVVNNIVADPDGGGTRGIDVNYDIDPWTVLAESTGNLVFGFNDNSVFPPPVTSSGDDTSGAWSLATVFADADNGDFHLLPGGPGAGAGANVHGLPLYGTITKDLDQAPRPPSGAWDRGALQQ